MSGFLSDIELVAKRNLLVNPSLASSELVLPVNQIRLIQSLPFPCSGSILSIAFTAKRASGTRYPYLQVWTQNRTNSNLYSRRGQVSLSNPSLESLNTYKLQLPEPLLVQRGDVVGLQLPDVARAAILLQFTRSARQNVGNNSSLRSYSSSLSTDNENVFDISGSVIALDNSQPLLQVEMSKYTHSQ